MIQIVNKLTLKIMKFYIITNSQFIR